MIVTPPRPVLPFVPSACVKVARSICAVQLSIPEFTPYKKSSQGIRNLSSLSVSNRPHGMLQFVVLLPPFVAMLYVLGNLTGSLPPSPTSLVPSVCLCYSTPAAVTVRSTIARLRKGQTETGK